MKKLLLLLPMLATVSMYGMDEPTSTWKDRLRTFKEKWTSCCTIIIDASPKTITRQVGLEPYANQLRATPPLPSLFERQEVDQNQVTYSSSSSGTPYSTPIHSERPSPVLFDQALADTKKYLGSQDS